MIAWMVYALLVSALASAAAWLGERGARAARWPARWFWVGALVVSVGGPVLAWLVPRRSPTEPPLTAVPGDYVLRSIQLPAAPAASPSGPALETVIASAWVAASALLLGALVVLAARLHRRRQGWRVDVVDDVQVLVSRATGPAAIGLVRGRVVVPEWALGLDAPRRRLLVLHEAEHVRARDPQLALAALVLCALAPWNLALWWQLRRLRLAIEVDCDARVLRRAGEPRLYGSLLLTVGQRKAHLALALSESPRSLERRIRMIAENGKAGRAWLKGGLLLALAGLLLALACETPGPVVPASPEPRADDPAADAAAADTDADADRSDATEPRGDPVDDLAEGPTFTPMTVRPQVTNVERVREALESEYPPLLRNAGIGGSIQVWFFIDETGDVVRTELNEGSGHDALDEAALRVAERMEFSPAYNGDDPVPVWVSLAITFESDAGTESEAEREPAPERSAAEPNPGPVRSPDAAPEPIGVEGDPTFTPMTRRPEVTNMEQVREALDSEYPPMLRDAGIGGAVQVWFYIDEAGTVRDLRVHQSSGEPAMDAAALRVADAMEFSPAYNGDEPAAVWVSLRIAFEPR